MFFYVYQAPNALWGSGSGLEKRQPLAFSLWYRVGIFEATLLTSPLSVYFLYFDIVEIDLSLLFFCFFGNHPQPKTNTRNGEGWGYCLRCFFSHPLLWFGSCFLRLPFSFCLASICLANRTLFYFPPCLRGSFAWDSLLVPKTFLALLWTHQHSSCSRKCFSCVAL